MRDMPYKNKGLQKMGLRAAVFNLFFALCVFLSPAQAETAQPLRILAFGDSLTAGYGLASSEALPARIEYFLKQKGYNVTLMNAGVSGDTTSGGLARLEWTLEDKPDAVILALGGNDMLRAIDPKITEDNLRKMMDILKNHKMPVLVAGMQSLRNLTPFFGDSFQKMYKGIAKDYDAEFYPFLLDGVATQADLNQPDGIHPNAAGVDIIAQRMLPSVENLIKRAQKNGE